MDVRQLKHKLLHDKQLAPIYDYFLDHFSNTEFIARGAAFRHTMLETMIANIACQISPGEILVLKQFIRIPEESFVHGTFILAGRLGGVIYFEDRQTGLVAVPAPAPSVEVQYVRFKAILSPPEPSRN